MAWPAARVEQLAAELAEDLAAAGRFAESATLLADYTGDAAGAVGRLVQAEAWREALRTAYRFVYRLSGVAENAHECPEAGSLPLPTVHSVRARVWLWTDTCQK